MKVRTGFEFSEEDRRRIRASIARGGQATRRECVTFIDRVVRAALADQELPRTRTKRVKGADPSARPDVPAEREGEVAVAQRRRIAALYGHEGAVR